MLWSTIYVLVYTLNTFCRELRADYPMLPEVCEASHPCLLQKFIAGRPRSKTPNYINPQAFGSLCIQSDFFCPVLLLPRPIPFRLLLVNILYYQHFLSICFGRTQPADEYLLCIRHSLGAGESAKNIQTKALTPWRSCFRGVPGNTAARVVKQCMREGSPPISFLPLRQK